ncbi:MAG: pectate lyase, partial [Gammaproteobacteria bacterium]|nr:pectate lyase [Gammaproteobacteria bacterium]
MLALRAAVLSLSFVAATSASEPLTISWRDQLTADPKWQQYFARSEYLLQLDQQQLQQELTQLDQHAPTLPAKDLKFGFPPEPNPAFWLSAEASRIARVILSFQTPSGGWSKRTDMASRPRQPGQLYGTEVDYIPTFDNDATSTQILWLTA